VVSVGSVPFFDAHWRTQVGDAIELGATFVNQHAEDVTRDEGITSLRGEAAIFGSPRVTASSRGSCPAAPVASL
jgi:hypothetical protein